MLLSKSEINKLSQKELTQDIVEYFKEKYGNRFIRALRSVEEGRVFKYKFTPSETTVWIVKGKRREYIAIPNIYCTCRAFYQDVVIAREVKICYHLLAQMIAEIRGSYQPIEASDSERRRLFIEWRRTD
jgi:predicted nucleic acid-binding Zn finger protein